MTRAFTSKKDLVYEAVREAIIVGKFAPGDRLVIDEIAREYNVSPIPVREALQMLGREGFVSFRPHAGATVTSLSAEEIDEVFDLLESLEVISARAACRHASDDQLQRLRHLVARMETQTSKPEAWSSTNMEFHSAICEAAGYQLTLRLLESVRVHWDRIRHLFYSESHHHIPEAQQDHWQILRALETRDEEAVIRYLKAHNASARQSYRDRRESAQQDVG